MLFDSIHPSRQSTQPRCGDAAVRTRVGRSVMLCLAGAWLLAATGCARRAYTDVYVENMASEIRDLEDQLYEFDSEYRALEQELDALHAENARLRSTLPSAAATGKSALGMSQPTAPGSSSQQFLPPPGTSGTTPPPSSRRSTGGEPGAAPSLDSRPPAAPATGTPGNPLSPSELPVPQQVPGATETDPYDLKNLAPPTIEHGEAMPPKLPAPKTDAATPLSLGAPDDLEVELGQIQLPAQLASTAGAMSASGPARLPAVAEMPRDARIVEVKFHPSLCRAVNLDGEGDDDGLSLVLQPLNSSGQFVPLPAELLVVAIDPSRDNAQRPTGRWTFAPADVKAKLQPIGSSQGIHLALPFNGPKPEADRLVVFVYYTLSDGRRVVAEQEIFLNNGHRQHTVWVPRGKAGSPDASVRTASGQRAAR